MPSSKPCNPACSFDRQYFWNCCTHHKEAASLSFHRFSLGILWSCWNPVVSGVLPHTAQTLHTVFVFFPIPSHSDVPSDAAFLIFQGWLADTYFHSSQFRAAPLLLAALSSVGRDPGMGCLCMHQSLSLFLFQKQEDQVSRVRPATKFQELCDNTPCWLCLGK